MQKTSNSKSLKKGWIDLEEEPERVKLKEEKKSSEKKEKRQQLRKKLEEHEEKIRQLQLIIESLKQPDNQNIITEVDTLAAASDYPDAVDQSWMDTIILDEYEEMFTKKKSLYYC